jgi:hypothetical protein
LLSNISLWLGTHLYNLFQAGLKVKKAVKFRALLNQAQAGHKFIRLFQAHLQVEILRDSTVALESGILPVYKAFSSGQMKVYKA